MRYSPKILDEHKMIRHLFLKLCRAPIYSFPTSNYMGQFKPDVPEEHGVYVIYNNKGVVVHVGRTNRGSRGLTQRLNNHLRGQSSFVKKYLDGKGTNLRQGYQFRYIVIEDHRQRALVESLAIGELCPAHLGLGLPRKNTKK